VAKRFRGRGWLRLYIARANGHIIGVEYAFCFQRRYYFYLNGFDPEVARYSLGSLLMVEAIHQAIAEGCAEIDFLRGEEAYKAQLGAINERVNGRLLLRRRHNIRGRTMLWLDGLPERLVPVIMLKKRLVQAFQRVRASTISEGKQDSVNSTQDR
jgi:CelD/BcsL family acetyltransferase involved in cellulose biosynthesis